MSTTVVTVRELGAEKRLWIAALVALYVAVFWDVGREWAADCWELEDFSHCLLVPLVSAFVLWSRRSELGACEARRSTFAGLLSAASIVLFLAGVAASYNLFQRVGAIGCFVGLFGMLFGSRALRQNVFPFAYLVLAIPIPFVIYTTISVQLRTLVTAAAARLLQLLGVPAFNDGNVLAIGELRLGVIDACSGIRSVMAIVSVAVLLAYLKRAGWIGGGLLLALTVPIAVFLNTVRVIVVAYARHVFALDLSEGLPHDILGIVVFGLILVSMYLSWLLVGWLIMHDDRLPERAGRSA